MGREGALHLVPGRAALHRDRALGGVDGEDVIEAAHVEPHAARGVGLTALAVAAAGDRDLEPAGVGVADDGAELLDVAGVLEPRDAGRGDAGDVACEQRIGGAKPGVVRNGEGAGIRE